MTERNRHRRGIAGRTARSGVSPTWSRVAGASAGSIARRAMPAALGLVWALAHGGEAAAQATFSSRCGADVHGEEATGLVVFPQDDLFCPLLADPKQPRTSLSVQRGRFPTLEDPDRGPQTTIGSVGLGDRFGLIRWGGARAGDGLQLDVAGAIFAQFDLGTPSFDLINSDYLIGIPVIYRRGGSSLRLRLYHQSSHLGDEYLLRDDGIERENLSFESFELLVSRELGAVRLYGGGEHLFRREPETLDRRLVHGGAELRSAAVGAFRIVAGVDAKLSEQQSWEPAWSLRAGVQVARPARGGHPVRLLLLMAELYTGPSPYGQFFQDDIRYAGLGIHLLL